MKTKLIRRRMTALFIVMMLVFGVMEGSVLALAPDSNQLCTLTVHKYSRTTSPTKGNPTGELLTPDESAGLGTPLNGAEFTLYQVTMPTLAAGVSLTGSYTVSGDYGTITFDTTDGTTSATAVGTADTTSGKVRTTAGAGTADFTALAQGQYLLVETGIPAGYQGAEPTIISLPLTNLEGTDFNYDVHVYPKNVSSKPITKVLGNAAKTYNTGDIAAFTIEAAFKNNEQQEADKVSSVNDLRAETDYGAMIVSDDLVAGLDYNSSTVSLMKPDGTTVELAQGVDYSLSGVVAMAGDDLKWELTQAGIDKAITNAAVALQIEMDTTVCISNNVLINKASSMAKKANSLITLQAEVTPDVAVPTGNIEISKIDGAQGTATAGNALAGAVFALATDAAGTEFLKPDGTTKTFTNNADLIADTAIVKATTDAAGQAFFTGLTYDKTNGSIYYLVEIQAPAGYQLKEAPIEVSFSKEVADLNIMVSVEVGNYENGLTDPDNPKFKLPLTGGQGTMMVTAIGVVLLAAALILYLIKRKKKEIK